jgi:N-acetylneuraminate synthase
MKMKKLKIKNYGFKIGQLTIGKNYNPIIISEIGINHGGSLEKAIKIADAAINSGAKIIKHQTHILDDEYSYHAKKTVPGNSNKSIYEIIKKNSLNGEEEFKLMNYIKNKKKIFISTPFSRKAVDRLIKFKIPAFKIGSGECNNYPLVDYIAKFKKPIIMSTGMNSLKSVSKSVDIINKYHTAFCLMHCTNIYPTPPNLVNLGAMKQMMDKYRNIPIGLSDHTQGISISLGAVALGACLIEKHFTHSKKIKGPDISASMDPNELKQLIKGSKEIFLARGGKKNPLKEEKITMKFAFASVVSIKKIKKGERLNKKNIWVKRPGTGYFTAKNYFNLLGKKVRRDIEVGEQLKKKDI